MKLALCKLYCALRLQTLLYWLMRPGFNYRAKILFKGFNDPHYKRTLWERAFLKVLMALFDLVNAPQTYVAYAHMEYRNRQIKQLNQDIQRTVDWLREVCACAQCGKQPHIYNDPDPCVCPGGPT